MNLTDYVHLAPVLLTGVFAFLGTWAGIRFSHVNEHNQWLRNEKMAACSDFLHSVERLIESDLKSRDRRILNEAVDGARILSYSRLALVSPLEVSNAAINLKDSVIDLATLIVERAQVGPDPVWDEHIASALQKARNFKTQFVLESSNDLNSGLFKGLGPFRGVAMLLFRWRINIMQKRLA